MPIAVSSSETPSSWDQYVLDHARSTPYHLSAWREIFEDVFGHRSQYLSAMRDGRIVGVLPLVEMRSWLFGRFMVSLPFVNYGGVLADDEEAGMALLSDATSIATAHKLRHIELRHREAMFPSLPSRRHKVAMRLALGRNAENVWTTLDRKVRNQVRKAEKSGLAATIGGAELVPEFYRVFARNMRDLGTPVYSRRLFERVLALFPGSARVGVVRLGTEAVAAGITVGHKDTVEVPWASSLREHASLCPNMLLYWSFIARAADEGLKVFDFGRSSPDAGTYRFKEQWGARPEALVWEYRLLHGGAVPVQGPDNQKVGRAIEIWKHLPLALTNRLGPPIVRVIP